ncbi:hypothetical protein [Sphingomonas hengshuiensis]|uniref:hypothetical protein n=1 Tax=Sphingomonas hengshuiensis TaxID=1609977 RepID=UPI0012B894CF|nr:hypothetical protein [Sphingomonas hengshuiensis]
MTLKIVEIGADYHTVKIELKTSLNETFFAVISAEGISFMSDKSSSGALYGAPIFKSADDLLGWFGHEGANKPFRDRKQVKPRP